VFADEKKPPATDDGSRLKFTTPESRGVTLWWRDRVNGKPDRRPMTMPGYEPLRVRVQVETQIDYFAVTFLIDVGNPWNAGQVFSSEEALGTRRKKIFKYVESIREKCEADLAGPGGSLDKPLVPLDRVPPTDLPEGQSLKEHIEVLRARIVKESVPSGETEVLLGASKYLYAGIWNELCEDFGFKFEDIPGDRGRVFANFRGLVMSTAGADHLGSEPAPWAPKDGSKGPLTDAMPLEERRATATPGKQPFRKFDGEGPEPNAVVKAFWPFIRRIKPFADYREYIACGVFDWRAIYVTALGSPSEYDSGDESIGRTYEVPSGNLPELEDAAKRQKRWLRRAGDPPLAEDPLLGPCGEGPVRYLLLTKYEPHRRQVGRIIDRINALGTMRLFALKSWSHIREASEHVRMRGQQLDQVMASWIDARRKINTDYPLTKQADARNKALSELNEVVELHLIEIADGLDGLGKDAIGGLPYRIARSRYYSKRFDDMRKTLNVGNIETWTSYDQFATRGLQPVFEFIEGVGHRLRALRQRLANVMQSIQTSALVSQSEETRKNSRALELLQRSAKSLTAAALIGIWLAAVVPMKMVSKAAVDLCAEVARRSSKACEWHTALFGDGEHGTHLGYLAVLAIVLLLLGIAVWFTTRSDRADDLT
jgi:hypothetical protein